MSNNNQNSTTNPIDFTRCLNGTSFVIEELASYAVGYASSSADSLPIDRHVRTKVCLQLLRHALSAYQMDYRIAVAIVLSLSLHHDLDDVSVLRRLLIILFNAYKPHGYVALNHWDFFTGQPYLHLLLTCGFSKLSQDHMLCFVAFSQYALCRNSKLAITSGAYQKRKQVLFHKYIASLQAENVNYTYDEARERKASDQDNLLVICCIARALGKLAQKQRHDGFQVANIAQTTLTNSDNKIVTEYNISCSLDTYIQSLRGLVFMAETVIRFRPRDGDIFRRIASAIITQFVYCLHGKLEIDMEGYMGFEVSKNGSFYMDNGKKMRQVYPMRYASRISAATALANRTFDTQRTLQLLDRIQCPELARAVEQEYRSRRLPDDVRKAVRALFLRFNLDVGLIGFGFGDFLVWCGYNHEISPLDPLLFKTELAIPARIPLFDEDNGNGYTVEWDRDENDHVLRSDQLKARHDFSLLLLVRAWRAPWKPESHLSFQPKFRKAVETIFLCCRKRGFPVEVSHSISSFLVRDWWEDDRMQCWNYLCQEKRDNREFRKKFKRHRESQTISRTSDSRRPQSRDFVICRKCRIARYCSFKCQSEDIFSPHQRRCCDPRIRHMSDEEESELIHNVFHTMDEEVPAFIKVSSQRNEGTQLDDFLSELERSLVDGAEGDDESFQDPAPSIPTTLMFNYFNQRLFGPGRRWINPDEMEDPDDYDLWSVVEY